MCVMSYSTDYAKCGIEGRSVAELLGSHSRHAFKKLGEKRLVGEIHVVANAGDGLAGVAQVDLDARDQCLVDPLLGTLAACLLDHRAQVTGRDAQSRRIELDGVVLGRKLGDQLDKVGEQALLARLALAVGLLVVAPQVIDIPQERAQQVQCHLAAPLLLL